MLALPLRNPVVLAKQIATLDYLSQGRCFPAVGLGQEDPAEYEACGVAKSDRGRRTDEAIRLMRRLWEEDCVTHEGEFFVCHDVSITPKPVLQPSPPVWVGGRSKAAAQRAGRVGDGWLVSRATPDDVRAGREIVFATATAHQRDIEADHIGVMLSYYISHKGQSAITKAAPYVTRQRQDVPFTAYSAVGTPEQIAEMMQQYVDAGACKFVVRPLCAGEDPWCNWR